MRLPKQLQCEDYRFVPIAKGTKKPTISEWQTTGNFPHDHPNIVKAESVGVVCGFGDLVVLDCDSPLMTKIAETLPETFTVKTPSKGHHYYFSVLGGYGLKLLSHDGKGIGSIRGQGGFALTPGSLHPDGSRYKIEKDVPIIVTLPETLTEKFKEYMAKTDDSDDMVEAEYDGPIEVIPDYIDGLIRSGAVEGERHKEVYVIVKELYKRRVPKKKILEMTKTFNANCRPPKRWNVVERHVNYLLDHSKMYLSEKVSEAWLKKKDYGTLEEDYETKSFHDLLKEPLPELKYWMNPLIPKNMMVIVGGRAGSFKSMFVLALALNISRKRAFLGQFFTSGNPKVLLYDLENGERILHLRAKYLLGEEGIDELKNFQFREGFNKSNIRSELKLAMKYDIIILDSYRRFLKGSENESEVTDQFYQEWLKPLRDAGKTVVIIHHFKKFRPEGELDEGDILELFRGSGDIGAQFDYAIGLFKTNEIRKDGKMMFEVSVCKAKNRVGIPFYNFSFSVVKDDQTRCTTFEYLGEKKFLTPVMRRREKILNHIGNGVNQRRDILKKFPNVGTRTIDGDLKELYEREEVVKDSDGNYRLPTMVSDYVRDDE